ncbi:MAG: ChaN family lipoprotein [Alkalinema sp. CAN_BIN05]|nr:ChaN family lipoprotein [Alkalinema sp. CAN_BIN05]
MAPEYHKPMLLSALSRMNLFKTTVALSLSLCFILSPPAWAAEPTITTAQGTTLDRTLVINGLIDQNIIYLGETHDSSADHQIQLEILQELYKRRPNLSIALEQFQRPYQRVLDDYQQGKLTEAQLVTNSEYETRWGFPWSLYEPLLQFAKTNNLPLIALNTPSEVTRKVARQGLASLTFADRRFIPSLSTIQVGPESYRNRIQTIYTEMHTAKITSPSSSSNGTNPNHTDLSKNQRFTRFFEAQVLWDETMADRIAQAVQQNPDRLIVVLVGQGHLFYHDGIPNRVTRRLKNKSVKQTTILLNPDSSGQPLEPTTKQPIADILWNAKLYTLRALGGNK